MGADKDRIEKVKRDWFTNDMIENFFIKRDLLMQKVWHLYIPMKDKFQKLQKQKSKV